LLLRCELVCLERFEVERGEEMRERLGCGVRLRKKGME